MRRVPFSVGVQPCPKCLHCYSSLVEYRSLVFHHMSTYEVLPQDEWLELTCGKCSYVWKMDTADSATGGASAS